MHTADPPPEPTGRPHRSMARGVARLPPTSYFLVSAVFHYFGPALAVLLFTWVPALGVAWLRIATAALVFAAWRRPWRLWRDADTRQRCVMLALGAVLAAMNCLFYLAIAQLPLSTVGAIEFLGTIAVAAFGVRTRRNAFALALAVAGVVLLTEIRLGGQPLGFAFAFGNCAGFIGYVLLGHRIANNRAGAGLLRGVDQLGLSMLIAAVLVSPVAVAPATIAFRHPSWLFWGVGVGLSSSVVPYVADQLAMARLPRATFALMLALLPAIATVVGLLVLHQVPGIADLLGIALVIAGVVIHESAKVA